VLIKNRLEVAILLRYLRMNRTSDYLMLQISKHSLVDSYFKIVLSNVLKC